MKKRSQDITSTSLQNSNNSQEQDTVFGHTTGTTDQMQVVHVHGAISV